MNEVIKYNGLKSYDIIDLNQTTAWNSNGIKNINNFLKYMNKKLDYKLYEDSSLVVMPILRKKYDIVFIDGSHDKVIVLSDLIYSDRHLVKNGIIIDDVLHKGVKLGLIKFLSIYKNYKKIAISNINHNFINIHELYPNISSKQSFTKQKKSFTNPATMFCFQKKSDTDKSITKDPIKILVEYDSTEKFYDGSMLK